MEEFDKWIVYSLTKDIADPEQKKLKTEALENLFKVIGGTVSSSEQRKTAKLIKQTTFFSFKNSFLHT